MQRKSATVLVKFNNSVSNLERIETLRKISNVEPQLVDEMSLYEFDENVIDDVKEYLSDKKYSAARYLKSPFHVISVVLALGMTVFGLYYLSILDKITIEIFIGIITGFSMPALIAEAFLLAKWWKEEKE